MPRSITSPDSLTRIGPACRIAVALMLWIAALLAPLSAHAAKFAGVVTQVIDGDTVWVRPDNGLPPVRVRIKGIDAPEICQPYGDQAKQALADFARHRRVTVTTHGKDDFDRVLGVIERADDDVGEWMVQRGNAWSYRYKGDRGPYARQEAKAKRARLGLWRHDRPIMPREFRVTHGLCKRN